MTLGPFIVNNSKMTTDPATGVTIIELSLKLGKKVRRSLTRHGDNEMKPSCNCCHLLSSYYEMYSLKYQNIKDSYI